MGTTINGTDGLIYMGLQSGNASPLDEIYEFNIETDTNTSDDGALGDAIETATAGRTSVDITMSMNFNIANGGGVVQKWVLDRDPIKWYAYPNRDTMGVFYYGSGLLGGGGANIGLDETVRQSYNVITQTFGYTHP